MSDKPQGKEMHNSLDGARNLTITKMVGVGDSVNGLSQIAPTMKAAPLASSGNNTVSSVISQLLKE